MKIRLLISLMTLTLLGHSTSVCAEEKSTTTAPEAYSKESQKLLENLQQEIKSTLLAVADAEKKAGNTLREFSYKFNITPEKHYKLGLVVDTRNLAEGLKVVSVDPASAAEQAGILVNDAILDIDGIEIHHIKDAVQLSHLLRPRVNDTLLLGVKSGGDYRKITLKVPSVYMPQVDVNLASDTPSTESQGQCGIVVLNTGSLERNIENAILREVNGSKITYPRSRLKLKPGKNSITVARGMGIRGPDARKGHDKTIEIDVQPGMKYYLGTAAFSQLDWIPVVWKWHKEECEN